MTDSAICSWLIELKKQLKNTRQRNLVVLQGDIIWSKHICEQTFALDKQTIPKPESSKGLVWGGEFGETHVQKVGNFRHALGTENEFIIFADSNFHPDAFAALSGTLVAGGLLIWLPSEQQLSNEHDLFIQRLLHNIGSDSNSYVIKESDTILPNITKVVLKEQSHQIDSECLTLGQHQAVAAIDKVISGHRKRPLVLTADRGRGKSSAIAIAIAKRMKQLRDKDSQRIIITAPHADSVGILFTQLAKSCPEGITTNNIFSYKGHVVEFTPIDVLLRDKPRVNLLVVDEAAGIPIYLLVKLVKDYHRIIFSSTQHGYEGAGRGFTTKFLQELNELVIQVQHFTIDQPIRWSDNDPLETLVFDSFLLNAELNELEYGEDFMVENVETKEVTQQELFRNEELLRQVFSVLVTAHYQTSPSDLKLLLNNSLVRVFVGFYREQVVAVSLGLIEGNVVQESISNVLASKSRMANQFIPQSLMVHSNFSKAFDYHYLRIMRIAVLPQLQSQGVGSVLLHVVEQYALKNDIDLVGTSFGVNNTLLKFWLHGRYDIARLGFTTDKSSGEHSAMLLKPISPQGEGFLSNVQQQFYRQFLYLLTKQYQNISPEVVVIIIARWPSEILPLLTAFDKKVVSNFIEKKSLFDNCAHSLHLWLIGHIAHNKTGKTACSNCLLLVGRLFQKHSNEELCTRYGFTGKKQLEKATINAVTTLWHQNPH